MTTTNKLVAWLMAGGAAVGGAFGGAYYLNRDAQAPVEVSVPKQEAPAASPQQPVQPKATEETPKPADTAETPPDGTPRFGLLRVEKDGSTLVAGNAAPGSKVELMAGGAALASTEAGPNGDFTIVLDKPLEPGAHELTLRAVAPDGKVVISQETGIVNLPKDGGELVAMVAKPGEATKVMQAGEQQVASVPQAEQPVVEAAPKAAEPAPVPVPPEVAPVLVSAVDFENGRIYVAGTGEPFRIVDIYIDDKLVGSTKVAADGSYLMEADTVLSVGEHAIRADMLAVDGSKVEARAAVPLLHEAPAEVAAVEQKPTSETNATAGATSQAGEGTAPAAASTAPAATQSDTTAAQAPADGVPALPQMSRDIATKPPVVAPAETESAAVAPATTAAAPAASETAAAQQPSTSADATAPAAAPQSAAPTESAAVAPAAEAAPAAVAPIVTGASVIIRRGDNLWRISRRMLGKGIRYTTIYEANRDQIQDPSLIYPGQVFKVPGSTASQ